MSARKTSRPSESVATLHDKEFARQFASARRLLKTHLVHMREILNGRDFLFLGSSAELLDALKLVVEVERKNNRFIHLNFAQVDEYFLLRVVGSENVQNLVSKYFE